MALMINHMSFVCGFHRRAILVHRFQRVSNTRPLFISGSLSKRYASTTGTTDIDVKVFTSTTTAEVLITNTTDIDVINVQQYQQPQQGGGGKDDIKTQASAFDYGILLVCPMLWGKWFILCYTCWLTGLVLVILCYTC